MKIISLKILKICNDWYWQKNTAGIWKSEVSTSFGYMAQYCQENVQLN